MLYLYVYVRARDAKRFTMPVMLERQQTVEFNLTYEELLTRSMGLYSHVVYLDPGEVVDDLMATVDVKETSNIVTFYSSPVMTNNGKDLDLHEGNSRTTKFQNEFAPHEMTEEETNYNYLFNRTQMNFARILKKD